MAWYEDAFTEDYDRIYMHTFTDERNRSEAEFIESALGAPADSEILDLACGHGRHALILAEQGFKVTGLDLSERFIRMAEEEAGRRHLEVHFEVGDMRRLTYKNNFEGVYSYFTSFGYFPHRENIKVLEGVARALHKGGKFLLETVNRDWILHQIEAQPRRWDELEQDYLYLDDVSYNARTSRVHGRRIVIDRGVHREFSFDLRVYSLSELEELIESVGMKIVSTYGGRDCSPFSISSRRMVIISERS
ncbi:MAG: class I SAM-dependent methyltransferase [Acidobacteriia bacterium]|nr:class I SAM-dependent methyltransferase [Terriglobia bacterium]